MRSIGTAVLIVQLVVSAIAVSAQEPVAPKHREKAAQLFEENDANRDGKLSRDEFPQRYRERFDAIDTNKDGFLTLEEDIAYRGLRLANKKRQQTAQPERPQQARSSGRISRSRVPEGVTVERDIVYARIG
ncbi:MAG: hypothetical protein IH892_06885, partial [Planctomycetes bacterium]|nr:hypothetical protein [Planctomycetota bacterium]